MRLKRQVGEHVHGSQRSAQMAGRMMGKIEKGPFRSVQKGLIVGVASRLGLTRAERHGGEATLGSGSLGELNLTKLLLVACDVLLQGVEQALGVLGSHDHTAEDLRGSDGEHVCEVDHKLTA